MTVIKAGGAEPRGDGGAYDARRRQSLRARYAYGFVFFATNLLAWFVRDYGARALRGLHRGFLFHLPSPSEFSSHLRFEGGRILTVLTDYIAPSDVPVCGAGDSKCFQSGGVLRVSLGCFVSLISQARCVFVSPHAIDRLVHCVYEACSSNVLNYQSFRVLN
jgi:hypothetical protein